MKHFALAGNPNCGKTTLFNALTGSTAHVGNWPGVTVDKRDGVYKKCEEPITIIDLPGIYSLSPYTPEEVISRNYILDEKPDCVINIVDATNLERNLYLTTQILEMDVPVIVALNMMDILEKNGDKVNPKELSKRLGVPVVAICAQKGEGIDTLMREAYEVSLKPRQGVTVLENGVLAHLIMDTKAAFTALDVNNPLFHAIKLIENDEIETKNHPDLVRIIEEFKKNFKDDTFGSDLEAVVADSRYKYINKHYSIVKVKNEKAEGETKSDKIDKVLTNKWAGIPIFLVILFLIFHLTFSENLFYLGGLFKNVRPSFEGSIYEGLIWTADGINSPGVILQSFLTNTTDWLSEVIAGWLESSPAWVSGLICDGILAGVFSVLSFIPQILLLFLFFSILEDSGYMARVAFILDRIFRKFGLSGRAFMPMIMGFGCSVPAMINTRTLADERERTATVRVIPFFSCGAKLPILTAIAGAICILFNFPNADLITYAMYLVGMITAIVAVIVMRHTSMRGEVSPFIMELPAYHRPQFKALMIHLWDKLKHYVKKAFTIILASTIVIWFLQSFTWDWHFIEQTDASDLTEEAFTAIVNDEDKLTDVVITLDDLKALNEEYVSEDGEVTVDVATLVSDMGELEEDDPLVASYEALLEKVFTEGYARFDDTVNSKDYIDTSDSILASVGKFIQPVFTPLGFGSQLNQQNGWVFGVSAVTGLIAKENVISTFAVLAQCTATNTAQSVEDFKNLYYAVNDEEGVNASIQMINDSGVGSNWAILIAFILFNMTTIPCFAAVATAKGELPKNKFKSTILFWIVTSYIVAMIAYLVLSYWWTSFIFVALGVLAGVGIWLINKYRDSKKLAGI